MKKAEFRWENALDWSGLRGEMLMEKKSYMTSDENEINLFRYIMEHVEMEKGAEIPHLSFSEDDEELSKLYDKYEEDRDKSNDNWETPDWIGGWIEVLEIQSNEIEEIEFCEMTELDELLTYWVHLTNGSKLEATGCEVNSSGNLLLRVLGTGAINFMCIESNFVNHIEVV